MNEVVRRIAGALAVATVLAQIAYPLVDGQLRNSLTVAIVVVFFLASLTHALATRGVAWTAIMVAVTAGGGLLAEAIGVASGVPFGSYSYADSLGPQAFGVPAVIPLAWTMMAYPAYVVAGRLLSGRLVSGRVRRGLLTGYALASWDLLLDPQMVDAGHWRWANPHPALPAVPDVPLTNYGGWLAVATVMGLLLVVVDGQRDSKPLPGGVPVALYLWTYFSSVLAQAAFFGLAGSALWGALAMGLVAIPLSISVLRHR